MNRQPPLDPPFRAEHIGSLLRPPELRAARAARAAGRIDAAVLRAAEDAAIRKAVTLQEELGFSAVTDGEQRRSAYSDSFTVDAFDGVSIGGTMDGHWTYSDAAGHTTEGRVPRVTDRLVLKSPVNVNNFRHLAALVTAGMPKITLPGPCYIHFRAGRDNISRAVYPDLDLFWQDLVVAYATELAALHEAGCRYVQLDETSLAKLGDPRIREGLKRRGDDWATLLDLYVEVINRIVAAAPEGMHIGIHLCRGNKAGSWQAEAGYDEVAAKLFRTLAVRFYFLEYDSPRAGSFAPLREVPDDKTVVLGLVSTKTAALESLDDLKRRVDEAGRYISLDRLAVSPQCGFASSEEGNALSETDQRAKLSLVVRLARDLWGYRPVAAA